MLSKVAGVLLIAGVGLSGCGGSSGGDKGASLGEARSVASLTTFEEAAQALAYVRIAEDFDEIHQAYGDYSPSLSKSYAPKLTFSRDCANGNGRMSYTDEEAPETVIINFTDCEIEGGDFIDGRLQQVCNDGSFSDDSCRDIELTYGEGQNALTAISADGGQGSLKGSWRGAQGSTFVQIDQSLELRLEDTSGDREFVAVTNAFVRDIEDLGNNELGISISGSAGLSFRGPLVECATGTVNFTTIRRVQVNANGTAVDGRVRITNANNRSATLEFLSTGDLQVTLSDGSSDVVPRSRFEAFCSADGG